MTNPANPFQPAIDALEKDAAELERQWSALVSTINVLREKAGLPPRPASGPPAAIPAGSTSTSGHNVPIKHDAFYGKRMGTAVREYLEMRKKVGFGPVKPREIFDALRAGGFLFETKDEHIALVSLRNMLRKNSAMFAKLPNGTYGLAAWYPNAKKPRRTASGVPAEASDETIDGDLLDVPEDGDPEKRHSSEGVGGVVAE